MPTWDPRQLQWLKLNDFSPGIADRVYNATGSIGPWPLGTAARATTFGCRALPNGALGPLPRRDTNFPLPYTFPTILSSGPLKIVGFLIEGRIDGTASGGYDEANWILATEYLSPAGGVNTRQFDIRRFRMWDNAITVDLIQNVHDAFTTGVHRPAFLESSRSSPVGSATTPGTPVLVYAWWGDAAATSAWSMWPNPSTPTSATPLSISTSFQPGPMIVYQGRSVICSRQGYNMGTAAATWETNEMIFFTNSNEPGVASATASLFTPEDPGEIMGLCVSAANELFVLKFRHGAYVIRGDITFPTVLRIPGVQGAGKLPQQPLASPIGVIYNARKSGMYVWPGGEVSESISQQMEPDNFNYSLAGSWAYGQYNGRMDFHEDLIFCPPRWCYNYQTKSWWQLEDPADTQAPNGYLYFQKSLNVNSIIACRGEMNASGENYAFAYNFDLGKNSYQWRSQSIDVVQDNDARLREIVLTASGSAGSTVQVKTISPVGGTETYNFVLTGALPDELRANAANIVGSVQIQILATGNSTDAAPIVYSVEVGYEPIQSMPEISDT